MRNRLREKFVKIIRIIPAIVEKLKEKSNGTMKDILSRADKIIIT